MENCGPFLLHCRIRETVKNSEFLRKVCFRALVENELFQWCMFYTCLENTEEETPAHIDDTVVSMVTERSMVTQPCVIPNPRDEQIKRELTGNL